MAETDRTQRSSCCIMPDIPSKGLEQYIRLVVSRNLLAGGGGSGVAVPMSGRPMVEFREPGRYERRWKALGSLQPDNGRSHMHPTHPKHEPGSLQQPRSFCCST